MNFISQPLTVSPDASDEWERIQLEFIAQHEAGQQPTLTAFAARYPAYACDLTDFVTDYLHMENAVARREADEAVQGIGSNVPAPYAVAIWGKTLASLGIPTKETTPEVFTFSAAESSETPAETPQATQTLTDLRKARNWSSRQLGLELSLPLPLVMKLEKGRIGSWAGAIGDKLEARIAFVFQIAQTQAEQVLRATTSGQSNTLSAAFSAEGDPDTSAVSQNRQPESFEDALRAELASNTISPAIRAFWEEK